MKKTILPFLVLFLSASCVFSQSIEERKLSHFDKVRVTQQIKVYLSQSESEIAKIVATGIEPSEVITDITGKTLEISLKRGVYKDIKVEVWIGYRELRDIYATASSTIVAESTLTGDKLVLSAYTGSQIDATLQLHTADFAVGKGGNINLKGTIGSYEAKVSSGGILSALSLTADSVYVNISTRAIAKVNSKQLLDAKVLTGSTLTITGDPVSKKIKSGLATTVLEQ